MAVAALFVVFESLSLPTTVAVLLKTPASVGVTTMNIVAVAVAVIVPRLQVITELPLQFPWLAVDETRLTLAGSVRLTVTPVAVPGPLLVTVIV